MPRTSDGCWFRFSFFISIFRCFACNVGRVLYQHSCDVSALNARPGFVWRFYTSALDLVGFHIFKLLTRLTSCMSGLEDGRVLRMNKLDDTWPGMEARPGKLFYTGVWKVVSLYMLPAWNVNGSQYSFLNCVVRWTNKQTCVFFVLFFSPARRHCLVSYVKIQKSVS